MARFQKAASHYFQSGKIHLFSSRSSSTLISLFAEHQRLNTAKLLTFSLIKIHLHKPCQLLFIIIFQHIKYFYLTLFFTKK